MSGSLAPLMLRIAAAVDGDGGAGVRSALQAALQDKAPFDGGELVYARIPEEHALFLLGDAREAFLGSDLVEQGWPRARPSGSTTGATRRPSRRPFRACATWAFGRSWCCRSASPSPTVPACAAPWRWRAAMAGPSWAHPSTCWRPWPASPVWPSTRRCA